MKIIITESQNELLNEDILPPGIRRRLDLKELKGLLDDNLSLMFYEDYTPCESDSVGDFIGDVCDALVQDFTEDYYETTGEKSSSKTKDDLYYYFVNLFGDELAKIYDRECD